MELKLFGKNIFEFKSEKSNLYMQPAMDKLEKSEFLPDFNTMQAHDMSDFLDMEIGLLSSPGASAKGKDKKIKKEKAKVELTPKGVYELKLLNDEEFKMNTDSEYVDGQLQDFKDKLDLMKVSEFDMTRGLNEISSIIVRMENRKKYTDFNDFFEDFAYTTTSRINDLVKNHDNLKLGKVEQFIADMPREAVKAMKDYTAKTKKLCDKKAIFYIIADKKDFKKTDQRRDPILLAQSPFGHFWQILGAWDEEMLFFGRIIRKGEQSPDSGVAKLVKAASRRVAPSAHLI